MAVSQDGRNRKFQEQQNNQLHIKKDANSSSTYLKYMKLCASLLLILGVCFISTICYLAIKQKSDNIADDDAMSGVVLANVDNFEFLKDREDGVERFRDFGLEEKATSLSLNRSERLKNLDSEIVRNINHCQEKSCKIVCTDVADIFVALHDTIQSSLCSSIDVLLLKNPIFPLAILQNKWLPANIAFSEVIIQFGKKTSLRNDAFNVPCFHDTLVLTLYNKNTMYIACGALVGFRRLKYLTIKTQVKLFPACILQPVQSTLLSLKLNARLHIQHEENLFDGLLLHQLAYLDLSHNIFNGSLGKKLFESVTNLKHLIITQSRLQHIERNAFENLAGKLLFLDLAKNRLTTLNAETLAPLLKGPHKAVINLAENNWICNCELKEFIELYKTYSSQLMPVLYCKRPRHLYATALDEVDFDKENCLASENLIDRKHNSFLAKTTTAYTDDRNDIVTANVTPESSKLRLNCYNGDHCSRATGFSSSLEVPAADCEFNLTFIAANNSVNVTIAKNPNVTYFVIWFSEQQEASVLSFGDKNLDYECQLYALPNIIIGPLQEDTTYTFCVLIALRSHIPPFNCLPLYVPVNSSFDTQVWISEDNKHLTIGMLCLIFLLSILAGAGIAYFGLRLLEGSKNATFTPDQACVRSISEMEYQKQISLEKHTIGTKQQSFIRKLPLPQTPPPDTPAAPDTACRLSIKDLKRTSSVL